MKLNTQILKEVVSKSIQGAGLNNSIPITSFMGIVIEDNKLKLITTDATNYFYAVCDEKIKEDFSIVVYAEQFAKLISKITSEFTYLNIKDRYLEVKANGTYSLELPVDEDGEIITKYPDPLESIDLSGDATEIAQDTISDIITVCKPSLAVDDNSMKNFPEITNYYLGNKVFATNRNEVACIDSEVMDNSVLLQPKIIELLHIIDEDALYYELTDGSAFVSKNGNYIIYSKQPTDIENYPIDVLNRYIDTDFKSVCKVDKNDFIALLERITLFVGKYDDRVVRLYFEKDGIRVSNNDRSSNELLAYIDSKKYKSYDCSINADKLLNQLKAYRSDTIEIHYNNEVCIKFVDEDVIQIIALMTTN